MQDDQERFEGAVPQTLVGDAPVLGPKAFPQEQWALIPLDWRQEAVERAAWLVFRGAAVDEALILATEGMQEDLSQASTEPSWATVKAIADAWPTLPRGRDGHLRTGLLEAAAAVERMAREEALLPGTYQSLSLSASTFSTVVLQEVAQAQFQQRVEAIRTAMLAIEDQSSDAGDTDKGLDIPL